MPEALTVASKIFGSVYVISGGIKLIKITDDIHKELKNAFKDYASVFPLAPLGLVPDYKMYKHVVGAAEVTLGGMIIFGKNSTKRKGCLGLMVIMAGATQAKLCLGEYLGAGLTAILFCGLGGLCTLLRVTDDKDKKKI